MLFKQKIKNNAKNKPVDLAYLNKKTPFWKPLLFLFPAFSIITLFIIVPFFISINDATFVLDNPNKAGGTGTYGFEHFKTVFTDPNFTRSFKNSILFAVIQIPISIIVSLLIASVIASIVRKKLRGSMQTIFFLPYVTSAIAIALTFAFLFDKEDGIINQLFGLGDKNWLQNQETNGFTAMIVIIINGIWKSIAFQVLIFTTAMMSVDKDKYKSASIDGAGSLTQFFKITLPSINKTLSFIITIRLIGAIKVFPLALFDNNPVNAVNYGGGTLMLYVYKFITEGKFALGAAASLILVLISICFSILLLNTVKLVKWSFLKGGEWLVENKIAKTSYKK